MFPRFFNKSHVASTSCVDIGVKLNAHIPKISTAPGHQRVYHPVLNIAGRKHRWIPSQKSACNPTLRVPIPPFLPRNTNFLTANRNNGHTLIKSFSRVRSSRESINAGENGRRKDFPEFNEFNISRINYCGRSNLFRSSRRIVFANLSRSLHEDFEGRRISFLSYVESFLFLFHEMKNKGWIKIKNGGFLFLVGVNYIDFN